MTMCYGEWTEALELNVFVGTRPTERLVHARLEIPEGGHYVSSGHGRHLIGLITDVRFFVWFFVLKATIEQCVRGLRFYWGDSVRGVRVLVLMNRTALGGCWTIIVLLNVTGRCFRNR